MATFSVDIARQEVVRSANHDQLFGYDENQQEWNLDALLKHVLKEDHSIVQEQFSQSIASGILDMEIRIKRVYTSSSSFLFAGNLLVSLTNSFEA